MRTLWIDTDTEDLPSDWHQRVARKKESIDKYLRELWDLSAHLPGSGPPELKIEEQRDSADNAVVAVTLEAEIEFDTASTATDRFDVDTARSRLVRMLKTGDGDLDADIIAWAGWPG